MKKNNLFDTLRFKLVVIALFLIMVPLIIVSIIYFQMVKEIIRDNYTENAIQSVYETGEKIDFILNDIEEFTTVIISNKQFLEMFRNSESYSTNDYNNELRNFITLREDIEVISLLIGDEEYSVGANKVLYFKRYYEDLLKSDGEPIWLTTSLERIKILSGRFEKYYFSIGRKIVDFNTLEKHGYLTLDFEESILEHSYVGLLDNDSEVFICNKDGEIISHPDKNKIGKKINDEPYAEMLLQDKLGHNYVEYIKNSESVAIYSTIDKQGWKLVKTIPTESLYKELSKYQVYIAIGGLVYGVLIMLFMIIFSIRYTEPMIKMKETMEKVELGDLSVRTDVESNDEVGQLGTSLNNMIINMQVLIDKLIKEESEKKDLELESLHAQINPHFLYNTLNTIKWMAKIQGNMSVSNAITALVKLLRISIDLGKNKITLNEEVEYVKNYIVIQKLRFNESIIVNYDIDDECLEYMIPKLILQPIVENSIIYGIDGENIELIIDIKVYKIDDKLIIEVKDNGPGIDGDILKNILKVKTDMNRFSKVGINNVNQRIKLYCGESYGVEFKTEVGQGTTVYLVLAKM